MPHLTFLGALSKTARAIAAPSLWHLRYLRDFGGSESPLAWEEQVFAAFDPSLMRMQGASYWERSYRRDSAIWGHCMLRDPDLLLGWIAARDHIAAWKRSAAATFSQPLEINVSLYEGKHLQRCQLQLRDALAANGSRQLATMLQKL